MSFIDCINSNEDLSNSQKKNLITKYNEVYKKYSNASGEIDASARAASALVAHEMNEIAHRRVNTMKDVVMWTEVIAPKIEKASKLIEADKKNSYLLTGFLQGNPTAVALRGFLNNTYHYHNGLNRSYNLRLSEFADKYKSRKAGFENDPEGVKQVIKAAMGEKSADESINGMGRSIREVFDELWDRYRAAGGIGGKIDNHFTQVHNPKAIKKVGFDVWKESIVKAIDRNKMIDVNTGMPMADDVFFKVLPEIYENIITNGMSEFSESLSEGVVVGGKSFAAKRSSSRFFIFKDADSFFEYNSKFGSGDDALFDMVFGHIYAMTRDIALMEKLGPKPDAMFSRMQATLAVNKGGPAAEELFDGMFNVLSGRNSFNGDVHWGYEFADNLQHYLRATMLTATPISMLPDTFFTHLAASHNGLNGFKAVKHYGKLLNPLDSADRDIARQHGLIASVASGGMIRHAGVMDDFMTPVKSTVGGKLTSPQFLAQATHRLTGASFATDASRVAIIIEAQSCLANFKASGTKFDELPKGMLDAFERNDITKVDYENMMKSDFFVDDQFGAKLLTDAQVAKAGYSETADKLSAWFSEMSLKASNEPDLIIRSLATGFGAKRGSTRRLTGSALTMFKSFPLSVVVNQLLPELRRAGVRGRSSRLGQLVVATTVLGALSQQASNIVNGNTPEDMDSGKFWVKAMMKGGGLGIFGDLLFNDYSRYGNTLGETVAGPLVSFASDVVRTFKGNLDRAIDEDQESKFLADIFQLARRNTPFIRMWYIRPFMERFLLDNVESMIDPNFYARRNRQEERLRKQGSSFLFQ